MTLSTFNKIFDENHVGLVYFVEKIVGDNRYAEDIVADAFLKLYEHGDEESSPVGFLYTYCKRKSFNYLRDEKRHKNDFLIIASMGKWEESCEAMSIKAQLMQIIHTP